MVKAKCVRNLITGDMQYDTLHQKSICKDMSCTEAFCNGSSMDMYSKAEESIQVEEVRKRAKEFVESYCKEQGKPDMLESRLKEVELEISSRGYYVLTPDELEFGAKMAWRNAPRCPGRIQWRNLKLFDCRHYTTIEQIFAQCCTHIEFSTNGGNIKPAITVFDQRIPGQPDKFRVWNKQLLAYACYEQPDGSFVGDKAYLKFTKMCLRLGWKGNNGRYDLLPLVISAEDGCPKYFEIPENIVKRVKIKHPTIDAISDLNLEWVALPAVSGMLYEVGGCQFPAAPFSGWYSLPEVASRDILDKQRYNMLEVIGNKLGFDTTSSTNLWRDKVNTEMNIAVLSSYVRENVSIVDHHTQSEQFMEHFKEEHKVRGGCPADWVWIVPPEAGSLTEVFHQEMLNYHLSPAYEYQEDLSAKYRFPEDGKKLSTKAVISAMFFIGTLFRRQLAKREKAVVYYATETGTSKRYAAHLRDKLSAQYLVQLKNLSSCTLEKVTSADNRTVIFFIASTFGNGDPPSTAFPFAKEMRSLLEKGARNQFPSLRYGVLGLGSSAYPNFCAFGKYLDQSLEQLGGKRIIRIGLCDELAQQQFCFKTWLGEFKKYDILTEGDQGEDFVDDVFGGKDPFQAKLLHREEAGTSRVILVRMEIPNTIRAEAGDHIAILPNNKKSLVLKVIEKLAANSGGKKLTKSDLYQALDRMTTVFDLTSVASQSFLSRLPKYAKSEQDKIKLKHLANNAEAYDRWKDTQEGSILDSMAQFPSVKLTLEQAYEAFDMIKLRWYSLASSPRRSGPRQVDLVLSVVKYKTGKNGNVVRRGFCSNYVKTLKIGSMMKCVHREIVAMQKPIKAQKPIVFVAAGSGIAPFRAAWQVLFDEGRSPNDNLLFFGCRNESESLFASEPETKVLRRECAFSRAPGQKKMYVQDLVVKREATIVEMIVQKEGAVMVCGSVSMAQGVKEAMVKIFMKALKKSEEEAGEYMTSMKLENRYIEEIFGSHA